MQEALENWIVPFNLVGGRRGFYSNRGSRGSSSTTFGGRLALVPFVGILSYSAAYAATSG